MAPLEEKEVVDGNLNLFLKVLGVTLILRIEFEIPFSNKCHVIIDHIAHYPSDRENWQISFSLSSEQVVEASHAKFDIFWQWYKVLDVERKSHGEQLLNCVKDFISKNV